MKSNIGQEIEREGRTEVSASYMPTIPEQQKFWDWHWRHWKERRTINAWKDRRHEAVLEYLRALALDRPQILDLGSGPGWYTVNLSQFGPVTAIDLSEEAIRVARARYPHITFIAGNLYEYPLPAGHFDVVVSQEAFDHVEDQVAFLDRAADFLRARGHLILSCTNKFVMDRLGPGEFSPQPREHISRPLDARELKQLLRPRFRLLRMRCIIAEVGQRGILRVLNSPRFRRVLGWILPGRGLEPFIERLGLGYQFILLAQKRC